MIPLKLRDRKIEFSEYKKLYEQRLGILKANDQEYIGFNEEMRRFLPVNSLLDDNSWSFLKCLIEDFGKSIILVNKSFLF